MTDADILSRHVSLEMLYREERQVLLGGLLGDGCISKSREAKHYHYTENHCIQQEDYLYWKKVMLRRLGAKQYRRENRRQSKEGHPYLLSQLQTRSFEFFDTLRAQYYPNGRKSVGDELLDQIDELGLTIWYLDDGSYDLAQESIILATQDFSYDGQILLQDWFADHFSIRPVIQAQRQYWVLRFNREEAKQLLSVMHTTAQLIALIAPELVTRKFGLDVTAKDLARAQRATYMRNYNGRANALEVVA